MKLWSMKMPLIRPLLPGGWPALPWMWCAPLTARAGTASFVTLMW